MEYLGTYKNKNGITFKEWLEENPKDLNVSSIICNGYNLIDLDGIQEFKNIYRLDCSFNNLTELPDLSNLKNLKHLECYDNKLPFKCKNGYNNLEQYLEWHKKEFPYLWDAKKYNL